MDEEQPLILEFLYLSVLIQIGEAIQDVYLF